MSTASQSGTILNLAAWDPHTYKRDFANKVLETKELGNNPYNLTSLIREICVGLDSGRGNISIQDVALANLDQLQFSSWKYIREFSNDYASIASKIARSFDE